MRHSDRNTDALKKARERKRRSRIIREEMLQYEADRRGITLQQLMGEKGREIARIIADRRAQAVAAAAAQTDRWGYRYGRW